jgi:hypothetical protein
MQHLIELHFFLRGFALNGQLPDEVRALCLFCLLGLTLSAAILPHIASPEMGGAMLLSP